MLYIYNGKDFIQMAGFDNIKDHCFQKGDTRGKSAAGKLGGVASGESKREDKRMRKALEIILNKPVEDSEIIPGVETTQLVKGMYALVKKMQMGDVKAAEFIRDLIGEKPETKITVQDIKTVPYTVKADGEDS